jgi:tetratricopeptide (TPR) repeat protein
MIELYLFLASVILVIIIVFRRHFIFERLRKIEFKKEIASKVDELKKQEQEAPIERFRDFHAQEQKSSKLNFGKYKNALRNADIAMSKKQWQKAKRHLIQAIALHSDERPASMKLAVVYQASGDLRRAINLYKRLLEMGGKSLEIYANLGKIYTEKKRYKDAVSAYVRVVESDEKNDTCLIHLGKLYQLLMRHSLAAECFRRAAECRPRDVDCLFLLADACIADGDYDNALFTYEKILTVEPYNERAKMSAQDVRVKMKETEMIFTQVFMEQKKQNAPVESI